MLTCVFVELFFLVGSASGAADIGPDGWSWWHKFEWDVESAVYTALLWLTWAAGSALTVKTYSGPMRQGALLFIAMPPILFLIFATGAIELNL